MYRKTVSLLVAIAVIFTSVGLIFPVFGNSGGLRVSSFKLEIIPAEAGMGNFQTVGEGDFIPVDSHSRFRVTYHIRTDDASSVNGASIDIALPKFIQDFYGSTTQTKTVKKMGDQGTEEDILTAVISGGNDGKLTVTSLKDNDTLTGTLEFEGVVTGNIGILKPSDFSINRNETGNPMTFQMIQIPKGEKKFLTRAKGMIDNTRDEVVATPLQDRYYRVEELYLYDPVDNIDGKVNLKITFEGGVTDRVPEGSPEGTQPTIYPIKIDKDSFEVYPATRAEITDRGDDFLKFDFDHGRTGHDGVKLDNSLLEFDESTGILSFPKKDKTLVYQVKFRRIVPKELYEKSLGIDVVTKYELLNDEKNKTFATKSYSKTLGQTWYVAMGNYSNDWQPDNKEGYLDLIIWLRSQGNAYSHQSGHTFDSVVGNHVTTIPYDERWEIISIRTSEENSIPIDRIEASEASSRSTYPFWYITDEDGTKVVKIHTGELDRNRDYLMKVLPTLETYQTYIEPGETDLTISSHNGEHRNTLNIAYKYDFTKAEFDVPGISDRIVSYRLDDKGERVKGLPFRVMTKYLHQNSYFSVVGDTGTGKLRSKNIIYFNTMFRDTGVLRLENDLRQVNEPGQDFRRDSVLVDSNDDGQVDYRDIKVYTVDQAGIRTEKQHGTDYTIDIDSEKKKFTVIFHGGASDYYQIEYLRETPHHSEYRGNIVPYSTFRTYGSSGQLLEKKMQTGSISGQYFRNVDRNIHLKPGDDGLGKIYWRTVFSPGAASIPQKDAIITYSLDYRRDDEGDTEKAAHEQFVVLEDVRRALEVKRYHSETVQDEETFDKKFTYGVDYTIEVEETPEYQFFKDGILQPGKYKKFKVVFSNDVPSGDYQVNFVASLLKDTFGSLSRGYNLRAEMRSEDIGLRGDYLQQKYLSWGNPVETVINTWGGHNDPGYHRVGVVLNSYLKIPPAEGFVFTPELKEDAYGNRMVLNMGDDGISIRERARTFDSRPLDDHWNNDFHDIEEVHFHSNFRNPESPEERAKWEDLTSPEEREKGNAKYRYKGVLITYVKETNKLAFTLTDSRSYYIQYNLTHESLPFLHNGMGQVEYPFSSSLDNIKGSFRQNVSEKPYSLTHTKIVSESPNKTVEYESNYGLFFWYDNNENRIPDAKELDEYYIKRNHEYHSTLKGAEIFLEFNPGQKVEESSFRFSFPEGRVFSDYFDVVAINSIVSSGQIYKLVAKQDLVGPFSIKYTAVPDADELILRPGEQHAVAEVKSTVVSKNMPPDYFIKNTKTNNKDLTAFNKDNMEFEGTTVRGSVRLTVKDDRGGAPEDLFYDVYYKKPGSSEETFKKIGVASSHKKGSLEMNRMRMGDYKLVPLHGNQAIYVTESGESTSGEIKFSLSSEVGHQDVVLNTRVIKPRTLRVTNYGTGEDGSGRNLLDGSTFRLIGTDSSNASFRKEGTVKNGMVDFTGLLAGNYKLVQLTSDSNHKVNSQEFTVSVIYGDGTVGSGTEHIITQEVPNELKDVSGSVVLTVKNDLGQVLGGVRYVLHTVTPGPGGVGEVLTPYPGTTTDGVRESSAVNGEIRVSDLPEGKYRFVPVSNPAYDFAIGSASPANKDFTVSRNTQDHQIPAVVNTLRTFKVVNKGPRRDASPGEVNLDGASFELVDKATPTKVYPIAVSGGVGTVSHVPAGTYTLRQKTAADGYRADFAEKEITITYGSGTPSSGSPSVVEETVINALMPVSGGIRYTLRDDLGAPLSDIAYTLYQVSDTGVLSPVEQAGITGGEVRTVNGVIAVNGLGDGSYRLVLKSGQDGVSYDFPAESKEVNFAVTRTAPNASGSGVANARRTVVVTNVGQDPAKDEVSLIPLTGGTFKLLKKEGEELVEEKTMTGSELRFTGLVAGEYILRQTASASTHEPAADMPIVITYGGGADAASPLNIPVEVSNAVKGASGSVMLTVNNDAGQPADDVVYELYQVSVSGERTKVGTEHRTAGGSFTVNDIPAGRYVLVAKDGQAFDFAPAAKEVPFVISRGNRRHEATVSANRLRSISVDNIVKRSDGVLDASKRLLGTFELIQKDWSTANSLYKRTLTLTAGSPAQFEGLKAGTYYLKQVSAETGYVAETTTSTFEVQYGTYLSNGAAVEHWVHKEHQVANAHSVVGGAIDTNEPSETEPTTAAITTTATTTETTASTTGASNTSDSTASTTEPVTAVTDTTESTTEATSAAVITTSPENTVPQATGAVTTNPGDTVDVAEQPENGIIELDPNGNWTYIPLGPPQKDKFVIKVTDEDGNVTLEEIVVEIEDVAKGGRLPHTGESSHAPLYVAGAILLLCGVYLARRSRMRG